MNIEETKKAIAVMQAFVDGKDLEQTNGTGGYSRIYCPKWNWDNDPKCYRIKPEPHYRPFKDAEEVMEAIKEHGDWVKVKTSGRYVSVKSFDCDSVWFGSNCVGKTHKEGYEVVAFADGTPFGKLED